MKAYWVKQITVSDPTTGAPVELTVYRHENGGMFAIDSSYIEQVLDEDEPIQDPFSKRGLVDLVEFSNDFNVW